MGFRDIQAASGQSQGSITLLHEALTAAVRPKARSALDPNPTLDFCTCVWAGAFGVLCRVGMLTAPAEPEHIQKAS